MLETEETVARELKDSPLAKSLKPTVFSFIRGEKEKELEKRRKEAEKLGVAELVPTSLDKEIGLLLSTGLDSAYFVFYRLRSRHQCISNALKTLERKKLVLREERLRIDELGRKHPHIFFFLSKLGRLLAKELRFEATGKAKVDAMADELIEKAVKALREEKAKNGQPPYATATEILEKLWQLSPELYENERKIFDKYWNKTKLGEKLREKYELTKKTLDGKKVWVYELYSRKEKSADLQAALVSIRKENLWHATTEDIKDALWKVCGAKFASKEVFEKVWNEMLIGRLMKERNLSRQRKYWTQLEKLADGTIVPVSYNTWLYDIRTVPKDENPDSSSL